MPTINEVAEIVDKGGGNNLTPEPGHLLDHYEYPFVDDQAGLGYSLWADPPLRPPLLFT